ncbi:MAG: aminotransferase class V-fold PLP-dependent enzyme, partial [Magnetococcales bacterium]|nr:aminotransferase class V-fold PLP-dependent enzyme [Magnetococcales bacterium]
MVVEPTPLRVEFPLQPGLIYLNHAGVAPLPRRSARIMTELATHMTQHGAARYRELDAACEKARQSCARLLGVATGQVAFVPNTSEGLSFVGLGIDWHSGDEIVTTDQEFPSNIVIWLDLARRHGLRVHRVPSGTDGRVDASALLERVTARTRVLAVSSVQFGTGAVVDLARIGAELRSTSTLFVVDGIQSLGLLPLYPAEVGIDALCADGHKWLLGPEGCGLLYLSAKGLEQIQPRVLGWHSVANAGDYQNIIIEPRADCRRFEAGSPNILGAAALGESIDLLLEVGIDVVRARVHGLVVALVRGLRDLGCVIHTPLAADGFPDAGILVFSHPALPTATLHRELLARNIYHAQRGVGVRFSPHFYQDATDVALAL